MQLMGNHIYNAVLMSIDYICTVSVKTAVEGVVSRNCWILTTAKCHRFPRNLDFIPVGSNFMLFHDIYSKLEFLEISKSDFDLSNLVQEICPCDTIFMPKLPTIINNYLISSKLRFFYSRKCYLFEDPFLQRSSCT